MENKIERLRESIKSNPNLTEEFKCNLGTLTDTLVTVFPDYDYSNYEKFLSDLKINNSDSIDKYSSCDVNTSTISLNTSRIFEDRIDLQHLFLNDILRMGSGMQNANESLDGFCTGLTEVISSTMNSDESMKKLNALEGLCMSVFSKIVNPQVLLDSYMSGDIGGIVIELESKGIDKDDFTRLLDSFNKLKNYNLKENSGFAECETIMIGMFGKVIDSKLKDGSLSYEDIGSEYDDFSDMIIFGKSELASMYPHYDFSNMTGFEDVKNALDKAVINSEMSDEVQMSK